jgi:hypothetical protein
LRSGENKRGFCDQNGEKQRCGNYQFTPDIGSIGDTLPVRQFCWGRNNMGGGHCYLLLPRQNAACPDLAIFVL